MKKKFLKGVVPVLLVVVMCMIQLLPAGAVMITEPSDAEITALGTNLILFGYALVPEFFGASGENAASYDFEGTMTAENADRILWYSFFTGLLYDPDIYYIAEDDMIVIPKEDMEAMITNGFMIADPDVSLSKLYDPQRKAIVITEELLETFSLAQPYYGMLDESQMEGYTIVGNKCEFFYHFINLDRSHSFRAAVEFEFQMEKLEDIDDLEELYDMNIKLCSFKITEENEMLKFVNNSQLHMEQNWYLCGGREKNTVADFQAQFQQEKICCIDNFGDIKTEGYVGTGDMIQLISDKGIVTDSVCAIIKGDIDGNGKITSTDYLQLKNYFKGDLPIAGPYFEAADIDNSGDLDSTDYLRIKKYMNGAMDLYAD